MKTKISIIIFINFLLIGCQDAYQRQSALNPIGVFISNSAQKDVDLVSRSQNPMTQPSYSEYKKSIEDKKFEPK
jgi:hypothetical protein